ncbi:MAG: amidohydrolase family protein [Bryobacteraceae bacterium]
MRPIAAMALAVCASAYCQSTTPLAKLVPEIASKTLAQFTPGLTADKLAITVIDLNDRAHPVTASYHGQQPIYPASVVKLFYLVAAEARMQAGQLRDTPELERAIHDMIVSSTNDATQMVVDALTETTGGPELDPIAFAAWMEKRNAVNRYFAGLGYKGINVNQKTFAEGPYGREREARGPNFENNNKLTTDAVARLLHGIVSGQAASPACTVAMMNLLHRDPWRNVGDPDDQATKFSGAWLPAGSQYFSKAGWTSTTRHDAAYIRLPNGAEYIAVVFTVDNSAQPEIIPFVSKLLVEYFLRTGPKADLILRNGRIWTGNAKEPGAEALASRGERIIAIGTNAEVLKLAGPATRVTDLQGKLALPGFIDDHTHFIGGGFQLLSLDLRDAVTQQDFADRIAGQAHKLGAGRWITGGDWDHELWPGAPLPTKKLIDRFTPVNPVFVSRLDGHMALVNSLVLLRAKITKDTPDPPGGTIVRDPKTGEPTGILKDAAQGLAERLIPEPSPAEYDDALNAALREAARQGVTSIQDITLWNHFPVYERFRAAGKLTVHVYARTPMEEWKRQLETIERRGRGDDWLRFGGLKAFMDGSLGSMTALFFEPFVGVANSGLMGSDNSPEGKLKHNILDADKAGLQCSVHAIGDRANRLALDYFEAAERANGPRDRRFRIEHAQHLLPADIPRFAKLGVIATMQPYHAIDDGRWAEKRIGHERALTTYAFRSLLDAGATVAFGSDWTVAPLSPLLGIYAAVTRKTIDGKNPRGWIPEQKITVEEAVRAYTSSGAFAEFGERDKGTLEVGKLADVVVLSQDIFRVAPDEIAKTKVEYTVAGGKIVYEKR